MKYSGKMLGKRARISLFDRYERYKIAESTLNDSFFGDPELRKTYGRNPTALGLVIIYGGIPFVLLCLLYSGYFYSSLLVRLIRNSQYNFIYAGSFAYFIPFNWYGSYYENIFLFYLMLFITIIKFDKYGKKIL